MFSLETKILIVDDMGTMRKMVMKSCVALGFTQFVEAKDGNHAWEVLTHTPGIGLILSDWNMPTCTGIDFLKRVRSDSRYKHLPFILITAEAEKTQIVEAIQSGCNGYLIKPFTPESIKAKLEETHKRLAK